MKRLLFVLLSTFSVGSFYSQHPNILIIIADDLGLDAMNGYSIGTYKPVTPHLDSLRAAGVTFNNAWSDPVCTSTRGIMMSGKYGVKTGVVTAPANLDTSNISLFKQVNLRTNNAYATGAVGKWHVAKPAVEQHPHWHGVDDYMGVLTAGWNAYDDWMKTENDTTDTCTLYATSYFTNYAANWINSQSQPWIMWLAHIAPHTPLHVPPAGTYSQPSTNSQIKKYMAMIENMDYEIGRLFDSIPSQVLSNTIVFFVGDNGTPHNVLQSYPADRGKQTVYQGGVNVPMIVSGAGVTRIGETEDALVNVADIYGTLTVMLDPQMADSGGIYNSRSFYHLLSSSTGPSRTYNYAEIGANQSSITLNAYAIRNDRYKLIQFLDSLGNDSSQVFYDLWVDPFETYDLLSDSLTYTQQTALDDLIQEATAIRTGWSCRDGIRNGDEEDVDCGATTCSVCNVGIEEEDSDQLQIYPNPATSVVYVDLGEAKKDQWIVTAFNMLGQNLNPEINKTGNGYTIQLNNINEHIIILRLFNKVSGNTITKKIIKQ